MSSGLSLPGDGLTLTGTGGGGGTGTVTSVSVASANGLAGTVANPTTTPALTLSTTVTGVLKGNGTALSAAVAGTDYVAPGGVLGTPSSGTLTNCAGLPVSTGVSGLGTGIATFLATPSSANLATAVTGETGSGALVFGTSPSLTTPALSGETFSTAAAVTAGTNAQGQGALTNDYNVITTAASSPSGVTLPTATVGRRVVVVNKGANSVNVYPASGAAIDAGGANAAVALPVGGKIVFDASSTTQWYSSNNIVLTAAIIPNNTQITGISSGGSSVQMLNLSSGDDINIGFQNNNNVTFAAGGSEGMRVNGSGAQIKISQATPAGGSTSARLLFGAAGIGIYFGSGAPTISATQGSIYLRTDGSSTSTRLYVNTTGSTTWTNVTTAA